MTISDVIKALSKTFKIYKALQAGKISIKTATIIFINDYNKRKELINN